MISINKNWRFYPDIVSLQWLSYGFGTSNAEIVDLPHTWNASDFLSDGGYRRGYGTYIKTMEIPKEYKGKRLFVKFEGAGATANVFVNLKHMGEHKGAYNAFTYEITDHVVYGDQNSIMVVCNNSSRFDLAPQGGDFNSYGGLYRDAWLIVFTNEVKLVAGMLHIMIKIDSTFKLDFISFFS